MTFLLDTHLLLWAAGDPSRLTPESRDLLANPTTELLFSTASIWEVVIKNALGRRDFRVEAAAIAGRPDPKRLQRTYDSIRTRPRGRPAATDSH